MKKKTAWIAAAVLLLAATLSAYAAGGGASDPLASLSYLTGTFTSAVDARVNEKLDASDAAILENAERGGDLVDCTATWAERRLKEGDVLVGSTGTNVLVLAGTIQVSFSSGAVIDVSTGTAVPSGTVLAVNHRYMTAEDTAALFTTASKTAVVDYQGNYAFSLSDATDYNAMAAALKKLHLFKGSFTGYGQGFDLEAAPTRLQALIMFIRVLGEEEQALAWSGTTPFTDIAAGTQAAQYVGYAYSRGYTNGYTATTFRPAQTITVSQYMEFILRAMGYSSAANTDLSATLDRALDSGVITEGERAAFQSGPFLRADLAYISYYALDAVVSGSAQTLGDVLLEQGVFTAAERSEAWAMVPGSRK